MAAEYSLVLERTARMSANLNAEVEFRIPADGKYVALVRRGIRSLAAASDCAERDCADIEVAVGEAVTNAVSHGCPASGSGYVNVRCRLRSASFEVEVEDESHMTCLPAPKCNPHYSNEHGRGSMLIHRLMDQVSVRCTERGMLVRMIKRCRGRGCSTVTRTAAAALV